MRAWIKTYLFYSLYVKIKLIKYIYIYLNNDFIILVYLKLET